MPRVTLVPAVSDRDGENLVAEANGDPVNNHQVVNTGNTRLIIRNSGAVARTVTIRISKTVDGQSVTSKTKAIPAGETHVFGPYPTDTYGNLLLVDVDNAELKLRAIE